MNHDHDVLLIRSVGGLGDLFAIRMLLHDLKKAHPGARLVFATPEHYWESVQDHPDIDQLVTPNEACPTSYPISYDCSTCCGAYEMHVAPQQILNRADIWATACGVTIADYDMRIGFTQEEQGEAREMLGTTPTVAICPTSSTKCRDLTPRCRQETARALLERGYQVVVLHSQTLPDMPEGVRQLTTLGTRQLMAVASQVKAAISVDTSHVHLLGGLKIPTVGVFSTADGYTYCRHYPHTIVLQDHEPGTYNWQPDMSLITAQRIIERFDQLELA